jgi:hypothetical protein
MNIEKIILTSCAALFFSGNAFALNNKIRPTDIAWCQAVVIVADSKAIPVQNLNQLRDKLRNYPADEGFIKNQIPYIVGPFIDKNKNLNLEKLSSGLNSYVNTACLPLNF